MQPERSTVEPEEIQLLQVENAEFMWSAWDGMGGPDPDVISYPPPPNTSYLPTGLGLDLERVEKTSLINSWLTGHVEDEPNYLLQRYLSEQQPPPTQSADDEQPPRGRSWLRQDLP